MSKFTKPNFKKAVAVDSERQSNRGTGYGYLKLPQGMKVWKETEGKHKFDIIPYVVSVKNHPDKNEEEGIAVKNSLWYRRPFKVHANVGANNDVVVCPSTFGKPCPICDYKKKRQEEGADWEEIKQYNAKDRSLYCIIPIDEKKYEEELHLFNMSDYCFQDQLNKDVREDEDYGMFPDLEDGFTLDCRFEEKQLGKNKFIIVNRINFKERKEGYDESIIDDVPNLDEIFIVKEYKELEAMFFETPVDDDDDDDKPRKKRSVKFDDEDEDEDEKPEKRRHKEEEEEDEKPTRRRKVTKDDDAEEEEKPVRRKKFDPLEEEEPDEKPARRKKPTKDDDDEEEEKPRKLSLTKQAKNADPDDICKACGGTGVSSKGGECRPCKGTGVIVSDDDDDDDDEKPKKKNPYDKQGPRPGKETPKSSSEKKSKCPFGHPWGSAEDEHKQCDTCAKWDECIEAAE